MGAADGPAYAPAKPGSKPIVSDPCGCPECVAGPGIQKETDEERLERILGKITQISVRDWCPQCEEVVRVRSTRATTGWLNTCENYHRWRSYE